MKATIKEITAIKALYDEKGLNSIRAYMKRNNIEYTENYYEFGIDTNHGANKQKNVFLTEKTPSNVLRFHYASVLRRSRKTGWGYNVLRAIEFVF